MKAALAVYATLFFAIYLYGLFHRLRELPQDIRAQGMKRPLLGLIAALCSSAMFVACFGWVAQHGIGPRYLWLTAFVVVVVSLLWSPRYVAQMQKEHGRRMGLYGYLLNTALCLPMDVVLFLYAFRSGHLWEG
ncbi:hypothetical protein C1924_18740 [Stenotrophomonas sp. ESTM1D_MKCIP4_1]|uniref:hypothetical protein n=1 Tax=Stenotrophomonas sp. ESTM1D_MKCIP4_1 TaxID=2072414 RepID=UPI000D53FB1F|nr:hypothetical protein [Stenotrophomonas sp. ESTM1D_MKCIP4_1]AWH55081.1 hypothetical protein C1924_18740 [Stenotrophomonas sp. ESTM1D_MKCIP4_1]